MRAFHASVESDGSAARANGWADVEELVGAARSIPSAEGIRVFSQVVSYYLSDRPGFDLEYVMSAAKRLATVQVDQAYVLMASLYEQLADRALNPEWAESSMRAVLRTRDQAVLKQLGEAHAQRRSGRLYQSSVADIELRLSAARPQRDEIERLLDVSSKSRLRTSAARMLSAMRGTELRRGVAYGVATIVLATGGAFVTEVATSDKGERGKGETTAQVDRTSPSGAVGLRVGHVDPDVLLSRMDYTENSPYVGVQTDDSAVTYPVSQLVQKLDAGEISEFYLKASDVGVAPNGGIAPVPGARGTVVPTSGTLLAITAWYAESGVYFLEGRLIVGQTQEEGAKVLDEFGTTRDGLLALGDAAVRVQSVFQGQTLYLDLQISQEAGDAFSDSDELVTEVPAALVRDGNFGLEGAAEKSRASAEHSRSGSRSRELRTHATASKQEVEVAQRTPAGRAASAADAGVGLPR